MSSHTVAIIAYVVLLGVLIALVVGARHSAGSIVTGGQVLLAIRRRLVGRIALVLVWWWLGWHLFVR